MNGRTCSFGPVCAMPLALLVVGCAQYAGNGGGKGPSSSSVHVTIQGSPASIAVGGSAILTVTATGAQTVTISGSDGSSYTLAVAGGTEQVSPRKTTTYTATAVNGALKGTASATVQVPDAAAAYLYVGAGGSIASFSAATDGTLTPVQTNPLAGPQFLVAANANTAYTVDKQLVHRYDIQADGGLKESDAPINTQNYGGGVRCGGPSGPGIMDRTGQNLTVELHSAYIESGGDDFMICDSWQTYGLESSGGYAFEGYDDSNNYAVHDSGIGALGIQAVSGDNNFAYGVEFDGVASGFTAMTREASGTLRISKTFNSVDPTPDSQSDYYFPRVLAADSTNHLAVVMYEAFTRNSSNWNKEWLASYTIDGTTGAIQSTNTFGNMPLLKVAAEAIAISPASDLVAVGGAGGLQIFHFNGADAPTAEGDVLLPNLIPWQLGWDDNHHLYVLAVMPSSVASQAVVYVYTVTDQGAEPVSGSPWSLPNGSELYGVKMVVVPNV